MRTRRIWRVLLMVGALALLAATVPISASGAATGDGYMFEISDDGSYAFYTVHRQDDPDSSMDALVKVYLDGTWEVSGSLVNADVDTYTFAVGVGGTCNGNTPLFDIDVTAEPGTAAFSWAGTPTLPSGYNIIRIYRAGHACLTNWADHFPFDNYGEITAPNAGQVLAVGDGLVLGADYYDDDYDAVQWAVRLGTCAMGTNTVVGNVDGFSDGFDWDGMVFAATFDTSGWDVGDYCFVFNPTNESSENYVRETRWFSLVDEPTLSCPDGQTYVSAVGSGDVTTPQSVGVADGYPYELTVEGNYYAGGHFKYDIQADAKYSQDAYQRVNAMPWTDLVRGYESHGEGLLEMKVDGGFVEWGAFAADHSYTIPWMAAGSTIDFQIWDIYAQNNTGGLCVDVEPVALRSVSGGGQIITDSLDEGDKGPYKVSFGGHIDDIDGGLVCEWQLNVHNVSGTELDKSKFHGTTCTAFNTWAPGEQYQSPNTIDPALADGVANFTVLGTFDGEPGYRAIFRMEDRTEPSSLDTFRVTVYHGSEVVFDTSSKADGDFPSDSNNVGTARTLLDNGNIQISFYE